MPPTATKTNPAATQAKLELEARRARKLLGLVIDPPTATDLAVGATLRDRDHREGCPAGLPGGSSRVEAYAERVIAPGPDARALRVGMGETLLVIRCRECGGTRYLGDYAQHDPTDALDAFTDRALAMLAGEQPDLIVEDLDGTL